MIAYCESCGAEITDPKTFCTGCGVKIPKKILKLFKKQKKDPIGLGLVIDESTSMLGSEEKVVSGVNEFIDEQKKVEGEGELTLVKFSGNVRTIYTKINLKKIEKFTDYHPNGMTALNDGIGHIISLMSGYKRAIIAITTDGDENSSQEFTDEKIKELITKKESEGWKFIFLAQGLSKSQSRSMAVSRGISMKNLRSFSSSDVKGAYMMASSSAKNYRMSSIDDDDDGY